MAENDTGSNTPESTAGGAQATSSAEMHASNDIIVAHDDVSAALAVSQEGSLPAEVEAASDGVEKLQLAQVFDSESSGNLDQYLSFSWDGEQTTIGISAGARGGVEQKVVLQGIDLTSIGDGSAGAIISALLTESNKPI